MKDRYSPIDEIVANAKSILESKDCNNTEEEIIILVKNASCQFKNKNLIEL